MYNKVLMRDNIQISNIQNFKNMGKKGSQEVNLPSKDDVVVIINPFEIDKKVRRKLPPPGQLFKDKTKYSRKQKYKKTYIDPI